MADDRFHAEHERAGSGTGRPRNDSPLKRLVESNSSSTVFNAELRAEIRRVFEVLERIEALAERELERAGEGMPATPTEKQSTLDPKTSESGAETGEELDIGGHIVAFDPAEFSHPPRVATPVFQAEEASHEPEERDPGTESADAERQDEPLERWWINFNGDVSLERLARVRRILNDSPFTIEARFEEITDGLIVLRVVTERHLSAEQVEWIVHQVMDTVGLDRKAALLSRN